jgi:hypothetical protein
MMNKFAIGLLSVAMLGGAAWAHDGDDAGAAKSAPASQTIQGEVLDLACYMGHGGKGDKHAECAKQCLQGGAPAGLVTKDGKVYVLVNDHKAEDAYQSLKDLGGEQAKITGKISTRGGLQAIIVLKTEKAD